MAKFLTFLGKGKYEECHYKYEDFVSKPSHYIQTCILDIIIQQLKDPVEEVIIFLTPEAQTENYINNARNPEKPGLKGNLEQYIKEKNLPTRITAVNIPNGNSQEEIWEIFDILMSNIRDNDVLYFDITHSFRFLPMLAFITLNYARYIKNTSVKGVFYGNIESFCQENKIDMRDIGKIPLSQRIAPLLDLTSFIQLLDWVIGGKEFMTSLNYSLLQNLTSQSVKNINQTLQEKQEFVKIRELRDLSQNIKNFSDHVALCRGLELVDSYQNLKQNLSDLKQNLSDIKANHHARSSLKPFIYIIEKLDTVLEKEKPDSQASNINTYLKIVELCYQNNLVQQGLTILQESLITYILEKTGKDIKNVSEREKITQLAYKISKNGNITEDMLINNLGEEIFLLIYNIAGIRNDINHCGFRNHASNCSTLKENLKNFLEQAKAIIKKIEKE